jgi:hypothetical protein
MLDANIGNFLKYKFHTLHLNSSYYTTRYFTVCLYISKLLLKHIIMVSIIFNK